MTAARARATLGQPQGQSASTFLSTARFVPNRRRFQWPVAVAVVVAAHLFVVCKLRRVRCALSSLFECDRADLATCPTSPPPTGHSAVSPSLFTLMDRSNAGQQCRAL